MVVFKRELSYTANKDISQVSKYVIPAQLSFYIAGLLYIWAFLEFMTVQRVKCSYKYDNSGNAAADS